MYVELESPTNVNIFEQFLYIHPNWRNDTNVVQICTTAIKQQIKVHQLLGQAY